MILKSPIEVKQWGEALVMTIEPFDGPAIAVQIDAVSAVNLAAQLNRETILSIMRSRPPQFKSVPGDAA